MFDVDAGTKLATGKCVPTTSADQRYRSGPAALSFIYGRTKQGVYLSHDGGDRWSRRGWRSPFGYFTSILINPRNTNEILRATLIKRRGRRRRLRCERSRHTWVRIDAPNIATEFRCGLCLDRRTRTHCSWVALGGVYVVPRRRGSVDDGVR